MILWHSKILVTFLFLFLFSLVNLFAKEIKVGKEYRYKNLAGAFDAAVDGDTLYVSGGKYSGNFTINKSLILIGQNDPIIDGKNQGTVLTVEAANVVIEGFTIVNSGILLDKEDAGILVKANNILIKNNHLQSVLFGIYFRKADDGIVRNNIIEGKKELDIPRRGDLVRIWYSKNLLVENNKLYFGRDFIVWFAEGATIKENSISWARYGIHFMYSNNCKISTNILTHNSVGMYLMYSKDLQVENNLIAYNRGTTGFGVGLKDLDNVKLIGNVIADNRVGIFIDNSPRNYDTGMKYNKNVIAYNETGVDVLSSLENSYFRGNSFIENYQQVSLTRNQNPENDYWVGNYWSDYSGFDKSGDGIGDIPYKTNQVFENLIDDKPNLKVFLYSPAINTLNYAAEAFPILKPEPNLIDKAPLLRPVMPDGVPNLKIHKKAGFMFFSFVLSIFALIMMLLFTFRNRLVRRLN